MFTTGLWYLNMVERVQKMDQIQVGRSVGRSVGRLVMLYHVDQSTYQRSWVHQY